MSKEESIEWVTIENRTVVGFPDGTHALFGLENPGLIDCFQGDMRCDGTPGGTAGLLQGAILLGTRDGYHRAGRSLDVGMHRPALTLPMYVVTLVSSYHNASRTSGNYRKAAARFRALGRTDIEAYLEHHAREENAHEKLALKDLNAMGLPGSRLVENLVPPAVEPLCRLFDELSAAQYPIGCIGYSYYFESRAARVTADDVAAMQALSPGGAYSTRFIRAHSSLGSEVDHVRDMLNFISGLPADDRIDIVISAYLTALSAAAHDDPGFRESDEIQWAHIRRASGEAVPQSVPVVP